MVSTLRLAVFALLMTITLASPVSNISRAAISTRCKFPGLFCLDCSTLGLCVETNSNFLEYTIEACDPATPCSTSLKACSTKNSFCVNAGLTSTFECLHEGLFPDPYDCNVYHECGDNPSDLYPPRNTYTCEMDFAFNPKTGNCDLPATDALCGKDSYPVPECDPAVVVSLGALPLDPHYYWICHQGTIHIIKCREGSIFKEMHCVPEGETPSERPPEETSEEPEGPPCGVFQCSGKGKEPDPQSCSRFYDCSDPRQPIRSACPWAHYYHQKWERCIFGFCPY